MITLVREVRRKPLPALLSIGVIVAASLGFLAFAYHWSLLVKFFCGVILGFCAGWLGGMATFENPRREKIDDDV